MRLQLIPFAMAIAAGFVLFGGQVDTTVRHIAIEWGGGRPQGNISVTDGTIASIKIACGKGTVEAGNRFAASQEGPLRLEVQLDGCHVAYGRTPLSSPCDG